MKMMVTPTDVPKDKQRCVIRFLTLKNVSSGEFFARMYTVYGTHNVITKSTWIDGYRDSRRDEGVQATNLKVVDVEKKGPVWYATGINKLIDYLRGMAITSKSRL